MDGCQHPGSGSRSSCVAVLVCWHGEKALLSRGEHRRRGLHLVGCCTSDYAGSAFFRAAIKAASGSGSAERFQREWRDIAIEMWLPTMCLLRAWTVRAAVLRRLRDPLLGLRAMLA